MDKKALETLLQQNLATTQSFVKMMFESLDKKITELRDENSDLKRSLEFSQKELEIAKKSIAEHETQFKNYSNLDKSYKDMSERLRSIEDHSRRNNLRVEGVTEIENENHERLQYHIQKMFSEKLKVDVSLESVHRIGGGPSDGRKPRALIAKLKTYAERQACLRSAANLKGTNIYLNEDVSRATHEIRSSKMEELREMRRQGLVAYFSGTRIISKARTRNPGHDSNHTLTLDNDITTPDPRPANSSAESRTSSRSQRSARRAGKQ